jgi:hypothetical protein
VNGLFAVLMEESSMKLSQDFNVSVILEAHYVSHPVLVLTQNVHPAPNTQQAEQSWLHTRKE